jgi:hypothetical protein
MKRSVINHKINGLMLDQVSKARVINLLDRACEEAFTAGARLGREKGDSLDEIEKGFERYYEAQRLWKKQ